MPDLPKLKLCLADDDVEFCSVLVEILREAFDFETFHEFISVVARMERRPLPDLLLIDARFPGWGVPAAMAGLKEMMTRTPDHPPVILITGECTTELLSEALKAGVFRVLEKPFCLKSLELLIHCAILGKLRCDESRELLMAARNLLSASERRSEDQDEVDAGRLRLRKAVAELLGRTREKG